MIAAALRAPRPLDPEDELRCPDCKGRGSVWAPTSVRGTLTPSKVQCAACNGSGLPCPPVLR